MRSITTLFVTSLLLTISLNSISQDYEAVLDIKGWSVRDLGQQGTIISEDVYNGGSMYYYLDSELNQTWKTENNGTIFQTENGNHLFFVDGYIHGDFNDNTLTITKFDYTGTSSSPLEMKLPSKMYVFYMFAGDNGLQILLKWKNNSPKHKVGEQEEVKWVTISPDMKTSEMTMMIPAPSYTKFDFTNYWRVVGHSKDMVYLSTIYENKKEGYKCELLSLGVDGQANVMDVNPGLDQFNDAKGEPKLRYGVSYSQKYQRFFIHIMNSKNDGINMYCYDNKGELLWENSSSFKQALKYTATGPKEILVSQRVYDNGIVAYHLIQPFGDAGGQLFLYDVEDGEVIKEKYYKTNYKGTTQSSTFPTITSVIMRVIPDGKAYQMLKSTAGSMDKKRDLKKASYIYTLKEDGEQLVFFLKDEVVVYFFKF